MAFTFVQENFGTTITGDTVPVTLGAAPTLGNAVCVGILFWDGTGVAPTLTVADANSNAYTVTPQSPSSAEGAAVAFIFLAYLLSAPANAAAKITATFNKAPAVATIDAAEFNPNGATVSFDTSIVGSGTTGTTINSPSIAPNQAGELLFAYAGAANTISSGNSPWTQGPSTGNSYLAEYILSSASGATQVNYTQTSGAWGAMAMALSPFSGVAAPIYMIAR